jgi:hypothetical protein
MDDNSESLGWLLDSAHSASDRAERVRLLESIRERLASREVDRERLELEAVVVSNLASENAAELSEAAAAVAAAVAVGRVGWACYHFAEAAYRRSEYTVAIRAARQVPRTFFVERDLLWRDVRLREIEAAALIAVGQTEDGVRIAASVWAELATERDDEFLAKPTDLIAQLVRAAKRGPQMELARDQLVALLTTDHAGDWLDSGLSEQIRHAVEDS